VPEHLIATKEMIEQLFDSAATSYNRTGPSLFTRFGERLVERMPLVNGARVLDVATGTGAVLLPAARRVGPEGHVTGIDLSGAILQEAENAVCAHGLCNVDLRKMDAEHIEFPDQTFDAVSCAFALFFFPDLDCALREMYRVCRPGGYVCLTAFRKTPPPFDPGWPILLQQFKRYQTGIRMPQQIAYEPEELKALLSRVDFRSIETHVETHDILFSNEEDWWNFQLTLGSRMPILSMKDEVRARFREEYLTSLRPMFREDGFHVSVGVVYAIAQR
jgi:O-methyltransferase/aklanonic acid methyltransferase